MKHHLQQQVAQLVAQVFKVAALNGVNNLIGFLNRVGSDGGKILLQVPRTAGARRAQGRHDPDQRGQIAGGLHRLTSGPLRPDCGSGKSP